MKKTTKILVAAALAIAMVFALVACVPDPGPDPTPDGKAQSVDSVCDYSFATVTGPSRLNLFLYGDMTYQYYTYDGVTAYQEVGKYEKVVFPSGASKGKLKEFLFTSNVPVNVSGKSWKLQYAGADNTRYIPADVRSYNEFKTGAKLCPKTFVKEVSNKTYITEIPTITLPTIICPASKKIVAIYHHYSTFSAGPMDMELSYQAILYENNAYVVNNIAGAGTDKQFHSENGTYKFMKGAADATQADFDKISFISVFNVSEEAGAASKNWSLTYSKSGEDSILGASRYVGTYEYFNDKANGGGNPIAPTKDWKLVYKA